VLVTGRPERYLRADAAEPAVTPRSPARLFGGPPNKLVGDYLAPYLSHQTGDAADVMPQGEHAIPIAMTLDTAESSTQRNLRELPGPLIH